MCAPDRPHPPAPARPARLRRRAAHPRVLGRVRRVARAARGRCDRPFGGSSPADGGGADRRVDDGQGLARLLPVTPGHLRVAGGSTPPRRLSAAAVRAARPYSLNIPNICWATPPSRVKSPPATSVCGPAAMANTPRLLLADGCQGKSAPVVSSTAIRWPRLATRVQKLFPGIGPQ